MCEQVSYRLRNLAGQFWFTWLLSCCVAKSPNEGIEGMSSGQAADCLQLKKENFLHKRLTVLLRREEVVVGSPWSMDCHLWARWASQTQWSSLEGTFPGVLRSRCFWLVLSARLTWYCWQASYLICGGTEPTQSILPCFFHQEILALCHVLG